jgi:nitrous-oxide reductase
MASRFSIPLPKGTASASTSTRPSTRAWCPASRSTRPLGRCHIGWQVSDAALRLRPRRRWQARLGRLRVLHLVQHRARHGQARGDLSQKDRDYIAVVDWKPGAEGHDEGKGDLIGGVKVLDPKKGPRTRLPDALRQVAARRRRVARRQLDRRLGQAPGRHHGRSTGEDPDRDPQQGLHGRGRRHPGAEVRVDQGRRSPGRPRPAAHPVRPDGWAYTSLFVDSAIAKWKLGTWEVVDKAPMSYSIGHLSAAEGDTVSPDGKYLVGLNKLSHGRHLSVGPSQPSRRSWSTSRKRR